MPATNNSGAELASREAENGDREVKRGRGQEADAYVGMKLDAYPRQQVDNKNKMQQVLCEKEKNTNQKVTLPKMCDALIKGRFQISKIKLILA